MDTKSGCPSCLDSRLKTWNELDEDEREVVRRLPAAREYSLTERQKSHTWCTRCWHECEKQVSRA